LRLNVHNPNTYELQGTQFSADVNFEGTHFGTISRDAAFSLPAETNAPLDLNLQFTWAGVGTAARSIVSRGAADYELRGRVLIDTPIDDRWVEIGRTGTARLEDLTR
jgi:LEA14-like dessication related protein